MTNPPTITRRCFIAVALPEQVQKNLARAQSRLNRMGIRKVKWMSPKAIHLTLAFLGNILIDRVHDAAAAVDTAVLSHAPFEAEATQLGYFGKRGAPRVIWTGIAAGRDELISLQASLADSLTLKGFELEERAFSPHLTIARIKIPKRSPELVDHLENDAHQKFGTIPVTRVHLIESILHPEGPEYVVLHTSDLRRAKSSGD
jgi:2'-5' RNA ligase